MSWASSSATIRGVFRGVWDRAAHHGLSLFALVNVDDHAFAVDILDPQANQFGASHTGRIEGHEDGARLQIAGGVNQTRNLLGAQHGRSPVVRVVGVRYGVGRKSALQNAPERKNAGRQRGSRR
jgi:hypothetical protein